MLNDIQQQIVSLEDKKKDEVEKREKWSKENQRRKHNYVPLVLELLKIMSEKKMLTDLYKTAEETHKKKQQEKEGEKAS
jgi:ubiquitin carboxyl-terminal hydrolase L5